MNGLELLAAVTLLELAGVGLVCLCQEAAELVRRSSWRRTLRAQLEQLAQLGDGGR